MKNFLIDLILVVLILILSTSLFSKDSIQQQDFNQSLDNFETSVQNNEVIETTYHVASEDKENSISEATKALSDTTVNGIKVVVQVFGEIVTSIFK